MRQIAARALSMLLAGAIGSQSAAGAAHPDVLAAAVRVLAAAEEQGLDPADYDATGLAARLAAAHGEEERARAASEVERAVRSFLRDLQGGRVAPADRGVLVDEASASPDVDGPVRAVLAGEDLRRVAASLEPRLPAYGVLRAALPRWRTRAASPEPSPVPVVPKVKSTKGWDLEAWDGAPALRARLAWLGEPGAADEPGRPPLAEVLRRFQARHGVEVDGVPGIRTVAALNAPASRRVKQIELAMERLRWFPAPGRRLVFVEVPRARLWAFEEGKPVLTMRLVVGAAPQHETPMMASRITGVVFRPWWIPPMPIVREEILPKVQAKPEWLAAHGMEIVASVGDDAPALEPDEANLEAVARGKLTIRQRPGPRNDLGLVKFVVPNPACIGLHGTPYQRLFERPRRDRSHGCVRLEQPAELADWVLRDQDGWDRERIEAAIGYTRSTTVRLAEPIDVAVVYATASVDPDGTESFSEDIYGLDRKLERLLAARAASRPSLKGAPRRAPTARRRGVAPRSPRAGRTRRPLPTAARGSVPPMR
jgi:L,D-transpeptidase YcbB